MPRLPSVVEEPGGLVHRAAFLSEDEERAVVEAVETFDFSEVRMHGQPARRTVAHFGYLYAYETRAIVPGDPIPESLAWLRERAGAFAGVDPELLVEALVNRYPPGAGIGWHRDAPMFGTPIVGVSLLAPCSLRFQQRGAELRRTYRLELEPRSAYALTGAARWSWQHSIPPTTALRYSVTFRTLRIGSRFPPTAGASPGG
jgi:alkylated DNA repair protein (DNA oxidative demethylase)